MRGARGNRKTAFERGAGRTQLIPADRLDAWHRSSQRQRRDILRDHCPSTSILKHEAVGELSTYYRSPVLDHIKLAFTQLPSVNHLCMHQCHPSAGRIPTSMTPFVLSPTKPRRSIILNVLF